MRAQILRRTVLWLGAVVAMASPGCGGDGDTAAAAVTGTTASSSSGGAGGDGSGGGGGAGGAGGGMMADNGHPSSETVSAGEVAKSPSYKMIFTFGQPTQNQGKTKSPSYGLQGGLVGANGSAP